MTNSGDNNRPLQHEPKSVRVPDGAPVWVTIELIEHTIRVWQPFYKNQLIPEDALEIIISVSCLIESLSPGTTS